jgi:prophage regulatory protein
MDSTTILRLPQVKARTGLSRSTIYARIATGSFPRPIPLGGARAVGWVEAQVESWIERQIHQAVRSGERS